MVWDDRYTLSTLDDVSNSLGVETLVSMREVGCRLFFHVLHKIYYLNLSIRTFACNMLAHRPLVFIHANSK